MTYRTILILLVGLALLGLYACDRENTVESTDNLGKVVPGDSTPPDSLAVGPDSLTVGAVLYVASGASGTGTSSSPFGSIQQAIDAAVTAGGEHTILIGTGTYNEQLTLAPGVHLRGRRDPDNDWAVTPFATTTVTYTAPSGNVIAAIARDIDQKTVVENLIIIAGDASGIANSSVGLYEIDSDSLALIRCTISAGAGSDGFPGVNGTNGASGQAGLVNDPSYGDPRCGGAGGAGASICPNENRSDGEVGFCFDGSQTGGAGGLGDGTSVTSRGAAGLPGDTGVGGRGGIVVIGLDSQTFPMLLIDSGITGDPGDGGCGGGGGGGGSCYYSSIDISSIDTLVDTIYDTIENPSPPPDSIVDTIYDTTYDTLLDTVYSGAEEGGWGGWGGEGGNPGSGGGGAGSSVAMLMYSSTALFENVTLSAFEGGTGGAGGNGGAGGGGGFGTNSVRPSGTKFSAFLAAGRGGTGGPGGPAGAGGGGTGGHSISLVKYQSSVLSEREVHYHFGPAGKGGTSKGNAGDDGVADSIANLP